METGILSTKKHSQNLKVERYLIWWECLGLWIWETASQECWGNCSKETGGEVRLYISLQPREQPVWTSKVRYPVKGFSILCMGRSSLGALWIRFFHMHCSYMGPTLFPCSPGFLHPPAPLQLPWGLAASAGSQLWEPTFTHSHLEARHRWWLPHFLFINMAGDIFIS